MTSQAAPFTELIVRKLFGRFDYHLYFDNEENLDIITAPNGFGKTVILRIIYSFFSQRLSFFKGIDFHEIMFKFADGRAVTISRDRDEGRSEDQLLFRPHGLPGVRKPWLYSPQLLAPKSVLESYFPVTRAGPDLWLDYKTELVLTTVEAMDLYSDLLPDTFPGLKIEPWLKSIIDSVSCHLIETQRLLSLKPERTERPTGTRTKANKSTSVVDEDAQHLKSKIGEVLQQYANESQKLDQTFPKRIIENRRSKIALTEEQIRSRLTQLSSLRDALVAVGLIGKTVDDPVRPKDEISDEGIQRILSIYIDDTSAKLSIFDALYEKIRLFKQILDEHFSYKKIYIDPRNGITAVDIDSAKEIPLSELSSGEQHELVLIYELIFKVTERSLILIDEPELSLHVAWQKRFISDIQKIQQLRDLRVVIATHSPQVIDDKWRLTQDLSTQQ